MKILPSSISQRTLLEYNLEIEIPSSVSKEKNSTSNFEKMIFAQFGSYLDLLQLIILLHLLDRRMAALKLWSFGALKLWSESSIFRSICQILTGEQKTRCQWFPFVQGGGGQRWGKRDNKEWIRQCKRIHKHSCVKVHMFVSMKGLE